MIRVLLRDELHGSMILADFVPDPTKPGSHWHFDEKEYGEGRWYPLPSTAALTRQAEAELKKQRAAVVIGQSCGQDPDAESIAYIKVAA